MSKKIGWSLTLDEIETLKSAKGGLEFEQAKSVIRATRGGTLPPDWNAQIIDSGLIAGKIEEYQKNIVVYREMRREDFQAELQLDNQV